MKSRILLISIIMLAISSTNFAQDDQSGNFTTKSTLAGEYMLSWDVCPTANTPTYRAEHYSVWISTTGNQPADFTVMLFEETLLETHTNWEYENREVNIGSYAGQTVYVAFRHHEITDMDRIVFDNVKLFRAGGEGLEEVVYLFEDFQGGIDDPAGEAWLPDGWTSVDHDGDGVNYYYGVRNSTEGSMRSESWNSTPLTPDNFLVTPAVLLETIGFADTYKKTALIFPNPVNENLNINYIADYDRIEVLDILGKVISVIHSNGQQSISINMTGVEKGIYLVSFYSAGNRLVSKKILKN